MYGLKFDDELQIAKLCCTNKIYNNILLLVFHSFIDCLQKYDMIEIKLYI